jgi:hypothetical protein
VNLYFLVEGTTERKIYPKWLETLLPNYTRVYSPRDAAEPYYLQALQRRIQQTPTHLRSLQNFLNLCDTIHNQSNPPPL